MEGGCRHLLSFLPELSFLIPIHSPVRTPRLLFHTDWTIDLIAEVVFGIEVSSRDSLFQ